MYPEWPHGFCFEPLMKNSFEIVHDGVTKNRNRGALHKMQLMTM
jgi:hypothetical protein